MVVGLEFHDYSCNSFFNDYLIVVGDHHLQKGEGVVDERVELHSLIFINQSSPAASLMAAIFQMNAMRILCVIVVKGAGNEV